MPHTGELVFLTGATGDIGGQTIKLLQDAAMPLKVMCRRQAQVDKFKQKGVDAVLGSLDDGVDDLAALMEGCDRLLLVTASTPNMLQHNLNATNAAMQAKLKWIVKISAGDTRDEGTVPWVRAHYTADKYLREEAEKQKVSWTILSPSGFMQNLLLSAPAIKKGFLPQTGGDGKCGWIDTADVAAVASQVLVDGLTKHHGQTHILTGPKLITFPDIARAFSQQIGHNVRYLHLPGPIFGALLRFSGADKWTADGTVAQFVEIIRPNEEGIEVSDAVEQITGKPPISIEQYAAKNKAGLQGTDILPYLRAAAVFAAALYAKSLF